MINASEILKKTHSDEDEYLEYLHDDLVKVNTHNMSISSPRLKKFNACVYLLSLGAIIRSFPVVSATGSHREGSMRGTVCSSHMQLY